MNPHSRDIQILEKVQTFLGGSILKLGPDAYRLQITNSAAVDNIVIPFLNQYADFGTKY